jgi:hypothetical protein
LSLPREESLHVVDILLRGNLAGRRGKATRTAITYAFWARCGPLHPSKKMSLGAWVAQMLGGRYRRALLRQGQRAAVLDVMGHLA